MALGQKILVCWLFGLGGIVCTAGITRVVYSVAVSAGPSFDFTWNSYSTWLVNSIELDLGIVRSYSLL
jgi:hypothetical protein